MEAIVPFALSNVSLTFLVIGLLVGGIAAMRSDRPSTRPTVAAKLLWGYLLFAMGLSMIYNFVMHVFFAEMAAEFIGWDKSPFQYEVGYASLGFGVVAVLARNRGWELQLAAILGPALFMWGAAGGHVYQMIVAGNFAPGNAGVIFWTDIFLPVLGLVLLQMAHGHCPCVERLEGGGAPAAPL
ncbi:MAG: hypothetical protein KGY81_05630 [Phycisphaerae bacterium]|jgi:hypothetical protein|nr:hypothetical protein [Phycisphaerae bacterium]